MLLNQYNPVPRAQLDCWEGRYVARAQIYAGLRNTGDVPEFQSIIDNIFISSKYIQDNSSLGVM